MSKIVVLHLLHINHESLEVDGKVVYYLDIHKMAKFWSEIKPNYMELLVATLLKTWNLLTVLDQTYQSLQ